MSTNAETALKRGKNMRKNLVMTVTGNDKVGIVEEITGWVLGFGGNVDASKMARLGGEFVMLMLVAIPVDRLDEFQQGVRSLHEKEYDVSTRETKGGSSKRFDGWLSYEIQVKGADHEGIIHEITRHLAEQGISVETMDTGMEPAPMSGGFLFTMTGVVMVPPTLDADTVREDLEEVGDQLNVDTRFVLSGN
ncbi:MAG: glycine cleavage system transcriptional repressor [Candidatus Promineifilaceae bacterium]